MCLFDVGSVVSFLLKSFVTQSWFQERKLKLQKRGISMLERSYAFLRQQKCWFIFLMCHQIYKYVYIPLFLGENDRILWNIFFLVWVLYDGWIFVRVHTVAAKNVFVHVLPQQRFFCMFHFTISSYIQFSDIFSIFSVIL